MRISGVFEKDFDVQSIDTLVADRVGHRIVYEVFHTPFLQLLEEWVIDDYILAVDTPHA